MRGYFTTHRGKVKLTSDKQHRFMHHFKLDHTHHLPSGEISRHRWSKGKFINTIRLNNGRV